MTLGERIKLKRKESKLTQKQLAEKLGIDHTTISKWESDTYEPDTKSLNALSEILRVSTDYLLGRKNGANDDELPPEVRTLARDWKTILPTDKELLKGIIKQMSERGKKAKDE